MRSRRRVLLFSLLVTLACVGVFVVTTGVPKATRALEVANGYAAKWVCSNVYLSGRSVGEAAADLPPNPLSDWVEVEIDQAHRSVVARVGQIERSAVFRDALGCTLLPPDATLADLKSPPGGSETFPTIVSAPWPEAFDPRLDPVLDRAFAEPAPTPSRNTRAVVVIHGGTLVAERYADGFDAAMPLPGWSMTKSWTHAWIGRAVQLGHIDPDLRLDPSPWPAQDPRHAIDLDVLLRMSSGLAFEEDYGDLQSTALRMLFIEHDMGAYAGGQPLEHDIDSHWYYSSGTTNLVSWHLRQVLGARTYWTFPHDTLFAPLGMTSARVEPDTSGVYVGSSYGWATARDWARFGQLYLQDGVWAGERLLPEGWAAHAAEATDGSRGIYGGHFWLNAARHGEDPSTRRWPELPADLYFASGYDGQYVVIVPSRDAVIVRLGLSQDRGAWDLEAFLADVLDALPAEPASSTGDRVVDPATDQSPSVTTIGE